MTDPPNGTPVLFLSNYFPPEVNALANRTWEHAREWARLGGEVTVVSGPPHFPEGRLHVGFRNELTIESHEGVRLVRVPMYVSPNRGFLRRSLSYLSYMVSAIRHSRAYGNEVGVVVASSPQFFAGLAGLLLSRLRGCPFVLEIRDLWPESIVEVGAMRRGAIIRALENLETLLYQSADHIVVVSPAFVDHVVSRGVSAEKISVLPNGIDVEWASQSQDPAEIDLLKRQLGAEGRFVVSYIGTVGMAHGLGVLLEAARQSQDPDLVYLVVGAGAEWEALRAAVAADDLKNVRVIGKQPHDRIRSFYAVSDASLVHLRDLPAFRKVIPSKMFESMAMGLPVILGVQGQAAEILEEADAGVLMEPEAPVQLLEATLRLKKEAGLRERLGRNGSAYVRANYDRREIARSYWKLLQDVARSA